MEWISGNLFFLTILLVCVGMHVFRGHGSHGGHSQDKTEDSTNRN